MISSKLSSKLKEARGRSAFDLKCSARISIHTSLSEASTIRDSVTTGVDPSDSEKYFSPNKSSPRRKYRGLRGNARPICRGAIAVGNSPIVLVCSVCRISFLALKSKNGVSTVNMKGCHSALMPLPESEFPCRNSPETKSSSELGGLSIDLGGACRETSPSVLSGSQPLILMSALGMSGSKGSSFRMI